MAFAHGFGPGFGFGLGFLNFIGTLLFFVVLFWFVSNFFRRWRYPGALGWGGRVRSYRHRRGGGEADGAVATARERFAQGEISAEEFAEIKRGLSADAKEADSPSEPAWFWGRDRAVDTARLRFAKGELSAEEFAAVKRALEA